VIPPGAKWESFAYSAHDAELIAQRKLNREETAAGYDIPPPVVGLLENATLANVLELFKALYQTTLPPRLTVIEARSAPRSSRPSPRSRASGSSSTSSDVLRGDPVEGVGGARKTRPAAA
jgi:phage portal protein BeeE